MTSLIELKGVGESAVKLLNKLGLMTPEDLVNNIPRRYDDYSNVISVRGIKPGFVTLKVTFSSINKRYSKKGFHITEALASDSTGSIRVMWFNQPYRASSLKIGEQYYVSGEFAQNYRYNVISNPACELVSGFPLNTARLVPQYKLTKGMSGNQLRKFTKDAFNHVEVSETLPKWLLMEKGLVDRKTALFSMHFPETEQSIELARRRVGFEEVFEMSLASELNRADFAKQKSLHIPFSKDKVVEFVNSLPFKLTDDQRKASWELLQDMTSGTPMNRLLEGDVGSGKTAVASIAMVNTAYNGHQSVLMAPTQLLANQHYLTLKSLLPDILTNKLVLITASTKNKEAGNYNNALIIVGTHALIQKDVIFNNLGLVVIDEQHRFGVEQRKTLQSKASVMPHVLNMTATPIPRSIALTLYGEMDVSILAEKPQNRQPVITQIIQPEQRPKLYESIKSELNFGRQAFIVCPLIQEDVKPARSLSVENIAKQTKSWLKGYSVAMLHGKMKPEDKEAVMKDFVEKRIQILVSTTVIEVGVDIPNASVMIIEGADKFGLAQLHQLRGRIGRGEHEGRSYLVMTENGNIPKRLQVIEQENDGFKLADYDLEMRGPGAIYGTMQHGALDLRVAKITDTKLIYEARQSAREFMKKGEKLVQYPQLKARVDRLRTITNLN